MSIQVKHSDMIDTQSHAGVQPSTDSTPCTIIKNDVTLHDGL
jgi:hypothetical protein